MSPDLLPIFDFDGTLLDSDAALVAPFVALGVRAEEVTFGALLADECARLGVTVNDYLERYDESAAIPFEGVDNMIRQLDRWAMCSNKHPGSGRAELRRLDWEPEVALFADAFAGPKQLGPVLDALGADARNVLFVGDTDHDRGCAKAVGCRFAIATWNPRASVADGDIVLTSPDEVLQLLR
ncbi:MAG TPA: HAD hydrolase-like protein [Acidimicrobiales bacterium]|nr:HAD hydrolase-like protein [Acidimicrobiales bacterium]